VAAGLLVVVALAVGRRLTLDGGIRR